MAKARQTLELTADYIDEHAASVHTYDSFGRAMASAVLTQAKEQLKKGATAENGVAIDIQLRVKPTAVGCLTIEYAGNLIHVNPVRLRD